jgi:luciferase family oxidoreductase group 1
VGGARTRISALDTSPIVAGATAADALRNSIDLARRCDALGYHRYWVAEHHGMRGVASAVPSITLTRAASVTSSIRLGAGGVMLPNHPALHVAEQYGMAECLFPGRIDLALGRAPGGTAASVAALRPDWRQARSDHAFREQLDELERLFTPGTPGGLRAIPAEERRPAIWMLGSSEHSARLAAERGLPYAFAAHLRPERTLEALAIYRDEFRPSEHLARPQVLVSVSVIAGETDEHAEWLAGSTRMKVVSRAHGSPINLPSPEEAAGYRYTSEDRAIIARSSRSVYCGSRDSVRAGLERLLDEAHVDELMVASPIHHHEDRVRSYELVRDAVTS